MGQIPSDNYGIMVGLHDHRVLPARRWSNGQLMLTERRCSNGIAQTAWAETGAARSQSQMYLLKTEKNELFNK